MAARRSPARAETGRASAAGGVLGRPATLFDPPPAEPAPPLVRVRLLVAYDGSGFAGFAPNPGVETVGGALQSALERVVRHRVEITCAGRTDRGVHAWGQVVTFDASARGLDLAALARAVNTMLGPAVVVRDAAEVPADFDARRSARRRVYRYTVLNRPVPDPFLAATAWFVPDPLDVASLRLAADPLVGEHDFASFCRRPEGRPGGEPVSLVRRVRRAEWSEVGAGILRFEIEADAFCHQMVRSVVGLLVDVGRGRRRAGEVAGILRARDRAQAGQVAPPHGLCLWAVHYDVAGAAPLPAPGEDARVAVAGGAA